MPIYEYRCARCGQTFDRLFTSHRKMTEAKVTCPHCNSRRVRRLISAPRLRSGDAANADTTDAGDESPTSSGLLGRKEIAEITRQHQKMGVG
jgi:putative FmdB family regulatory protein